MLTSLCVLTCLCLCVASQPSILPYPCVCRDNRQLAKALTALAPLLQGHTFPGPPAAAPEALAVAADGTDLRLHAAVHQLPEWLFVGPHAEGVAAVEVGVRARGGAHVRVCVWGGDGARMQAGEGHEGVTMEGRRA